MHYFINDSYYNIKVLANLLNVNIDQVYFNSIPIYLEVFDEEYKIDFEDKVSMVSQLYYDTNYLYGDTSFKFVLDQTQYNNLVNEHLYLWVSLFQFQSNQKLNISSYATQIDEDSSEILRYDLSRLISHLNLQESASTNVYVKIDLPLKRYKKVEFIFPTKMKGHNYIGIIKLEDGYADSMIRDHYDTERTYLMDSRSLTRTYLQSPIYIEQLQGELWMLETGYGRQNTYEVVDKHLYGISGRKDYLRHKITIRSFRDIMYNNFEEFIMLVKVFGLYFNKLYVNFKETESDCPRYITKNKNINIENKNLFTDDGESTIKKEFNDNPHEYRKFVDKIYSEDLTLKTMTDYSGKLNATKKEIKYFIKFEKTEEFKYVRLIGFLAYFYINKVMSDFIKNDRYLDNYFANKYKYYTPLKLNHQYCHQDVIINHIKNLPLNYVYIIYMQIKSHPEIEFNFVYLFNNWTLFVSTEKRIAFCNSPNSYLYPLPVIMEFNNFAEAEDLPKQLSEMNPRQRKSIEDYLSAYIDPVENNFSRYIREEYLNDIIHNSYFEAFKWPEYLKLKVTKFLKDCSMQNETYRLLFSYKIYDFSQNEYKNNEFKLIRYTQVYDTFEVYKEYFNQNNNSKSKFNGLSYTENCYFDYKIQNKECYNPTSIMPVRTYVANREIHLVDYYKAIYLNIDDYTIYDIEFVRDMIDYEYYNYTYVANWLYLILYIIDVVLILYCVLRYIPVSESNQPNQIDLDTIYKDTIIIFVFEFIFIIKLILDLYTYNKFKNEEKTWLSYIYFLLYNIINKLLLSEKIIDLIKNITCLWTAYSINSQISNNETPGQYSMYAYIILLFIVFVNFINLLKYVTVFQKLIIILLMILNDLLFVMVVAMINVIALTFSIYGIELFKGSLIDYDQLILLDANQYYGNKDFYTIFLDTITLAFLGFGNTINDHNQLVSLLRHSDIDAYPQLKTSIQKVNAFSYYLHIIFVIIIFFYVIILINVVVAVMGDTYNRVCENYIQYTYNLKANILLEYAWLTELRLSCLGESDQYILPWKIAPDDYTDLDGQDYEGQLIELKKHTTETFKHLKTSVNTLSKSTGKLPNELNELKKYRNAMNNTIDLLEKDNQVLRTSIESLMNKLIK